MTRILTRFWPWSEIERLRGANDNQPNMVSLLRIKLAKAGPEVREKIRRIMNEEVTPKHKATP